MFILGIGGKLEVALEMCKEEIEKRKEWLEIGDYTKREYEPIKNDIKRFKAIKKDLEKAIAIYKELETY